MGEEIPEVDDVYEMTMQLLGATRTMHAGSRTHLAHQHPASALSDGTGISGAG